MPAKKIDFWVYPIKNGFNVTRWVYARENVLFPGRRSVVLNNWADKRGARAAISRGYQAQAIGTVHYCECPLPAPTAEEVAAYRNAKYGRA